MFRTPESGLKIKINKSHSWLGARRIFFESVAFRFMVLSLNASPAKAAHVKTNGGGDS